MAVTAPGPLDGLTRVPMAGLSWVSVHPDHRAPWGPARDDGPPFCDVDAALTARGYSSACDVVLDVVDPVCPWNQRAWRLSVDDQGVATCQPTGDEADVRLPVQALGAAYLGSRSIAAQAHQRLVTELTPGTLRLLSRAMSCDREPVGATEF